VTAIVAVVPFGAVSADRDGRPGRWARQLARRLVERFAGSATIDVRPVFLVAMPEGAAETGYLVFGSTPDAALAAEYGRSLGAAYALTGTYREGDGRRLEASLVDVAASREVATFGQDVAGGELPEVEPALARWLAASVGAAADRDVVAPAAANEDAYGGLLEGMDAEVDATLLRPSDAAGARAATARAAERYAAAIRADPASRATAERILVLGASAIETEEQALALPALEALAEAGPRSWRAHYMLGEVRRTAGDVAGAIVAFEHSDALQRLRGADVLALARLYVAAGAPAVAAARLRRVIEGEADAAIVATARRLRLGLVDASLERDLETAGRIAVSGDRSRAAEAEAAFARVLAAEPELWEAHFGRGLLARLRGDSAAAEASFRRAVQIDPEAAALVEELEKS